MTDAEVFAAADALLARGVTPSNRTVLAELGRGSFRDIAPRLLKWKAAREDATAAPSPATHRASNPGAAPRLRVEDFDRPDAPAKLIPREVVDAEIAAVREEHEGLRALLMRETDEMRRNSDLAMKDRAIAERDRTIAKQDGEIFMLRAKLQALERELR